MSPVYLSAGKLVDIFHAFIFADQAGRAPHIYGLELPDLLSYHVEEDDPRFRTINDRLVAVLRAAVHLEYLSLPTTVNIDPVLTTAASLTTIRELRMVFGSSTESSWKVLTSFQSPLRSLRIDDGDGVHADFLESSLHDHLSHLSPTLEALQLHEFVHDLPFATTQFTAVRSLEIRTFADFNGLGVLLRLFPNLDKTLKIEAYTSDMDNSTLQLWSKHAQKTRAWSRLDHVVCNAETAFMMALQCPIRRMDIPTGDGGFYGLFPSAGAARENLTHLFIFAELEIRYGQQAARNPIPWNQYRDKLIDSMKHLRLTHLRLVFHYTVHKSTLDLSGSAEREPHNTAGDTDLYPTAIRFFDAMPTLQYVALTACGHMYDSPVCAPQTLRIQKWHSSKAWRVVRREPGDRPLSETDGWQGRWMELSRTAAGMIEREEELHLSPHQEVSDFHLRALVKLTWPSAW
ncbi:hypothetical protein V8D89_007912 [Ganoderma adspersum]